MIDRERRTVERRIKEARFPAVKSLDSFDLTAIPSLNKTLVGTENSDSSEKSRVLRITALVSPACVRLSSDPSFRLLPAEFVVGRLWN
jgi:hypothetical protein